MSAEYKALVLKAIERIFNRKQMELVATLYAPDCRGSSPSGSFKDRDGFNLLLERYAAAFPNFRVNIQYSMAEDDWVALHYIFLGTHTGPLDGLPATGRELRIPGFVVSRIANKLIIEQHFMWDNLEVHRQLRLWQTLVRSTRPPQEIAHF